MLGSTGNRDCHVWSGHRFLGRGLEQAGPPLLPQPVAVAADGHHMAVVEQPVEEVATTGSPNTVPHSPTERLLVTSRLPRS